MKTICYYLVYGFVFFMLSCSGKTGSEKERSRNSSAVDSVQREKDRSAEISRLTREKDRIIDSILDKRYRGGSSYYYDGEKCERSPECIDICESRKIPNKNRKRCYSSSRALVESLQDGFRVLISISDVKEVNIEPTLLMGMLDLNKDLILDLVKDEMNEGDLKSFLAWVAINEDIATVFLEEDRRYEVLEEAFKALGKMQASSRRDIETGLNMGLIRAEDSFFFLSSEQGNEPAFKIAYELLDSRCSSRSCKLGVLCSREFKTRSFSRTLNFDSALVNCHTSATESRRARREGFCYLHGVGVWSYLTDLIDDREIRDQDFTGFEKEITVKTCNDYCGDKDNEKCAILR